MGIMDILCPIPAGHRNADDMGFPPDQTPITEPPMQGITCVWTWSANVPAGWLSARHGRQDEWRSSSAPQFCPQCGFPIEVKPLFVEPPPPFNCADYGRLYQEWWWRKCKYYGLDPIAAYNDMLQVCKAFATTPPAEKEA